MRAKPPHAEGCSVARISLWASHGLCADKQDDQASQRQSTGPNTAAAKFQRRRCFRRQTFLLSAGISITTMPPADDQPSTAPSHDQERQRAALLILDMVNRFDFVGAEKLQRGALEAARRIDRLRREFRERGLPVIYVNDNFGEWHSESSKLVEQALERDNPVTELIRPLDDDFFVIKPQFSGFYATNLPVLLPKLGVTRLVLTGVATDICVLFTAADAHMRDYALWIPEDAVAAESEERGRWALEIMTSSMGARTAATSQLSIADWTAAPGN